MLIEVSSPQNLYAKRHVVIQTARRPILSQHRTISLLARTPCSPFALHFSCRGGLDALCPLDCELRLTALLGRIVMLACPYE
jgi:hypothetical protein